MDVCLECKNVVGDADKGICCELCERWFHIGCVGIPMHVYEFLQCAESSAGLMWNCKCCRSASTSRHVKEAVQNMQEKVKELLPEIVRNVFTSLEVKQPALPTNLEEIKRTYADVTKQHNHSLLKEAKDSSEKMIKQEFVELEKRLTAKEHRLCNIMISALPEDKANYETLHDEVISICENLEPKFAPNDLLDY